MLNCNTVQKKHRLVRFHQPHLHYYKGESGPPDWLIFVMKLVLWVSVFPGNQSQHSFWCWRAFTLHLITWVTNTATLRLLKLALCSSQGPDVLPQLLHCFYIKHMIKNRMEMMQTNIYFIKPLLVNKSYIKSSFTFKDVLTWNGIIT